MGCGFVVMDHDDVLYEVDERQTKERVYECDRLILKQYISYFSRQTLITSFILTVRLVHGIHPHQEEESLAVNRISRRSYISQPDLIRLE